MNLKETSNYGRYASEVSSEWIAHQEERVKLKYISPTTLPGYRRYEKYFSEEIGSVRMGKIEPPDINALLSEMIDEHDMSEKTARNFLSVVSCICNYAVAHGDAKFNVAQNIVVPDGLRKGSRTLPSDEDLRKVKESTDLPFGMFAYWLLYSGMRKGELLAINQDTDIDWEKDVIHINKQVYNESNKAFLKPPKKGSVRDVPIINKLKEKVKPGHGLLFPGFDGGLMRYSEYRNNWNRYCKEAGISCTAHQLRHAYTVMLIEAGVPTTDAKVLLGHSNIAMTEDTYNALRKQRLKKISSNISGIDIET